MMKQLPIISFSLAAMASSLMLLPQWFHELLYFDHLAVVSGHWWLLISGHWIHADFQHLLWNVAALAALGYMIESRSRTLFLCSLVVGMLSVDLWLFSPFSEVQRYCGLSGLLNTLLGVVLFIYWRETRSPVIVGAGLLCVAKVLVEMQSGQSIFTEISWPPYAIAHLAGLLGTPVALWLYCRMTDNHRYLIG